MPKYVFCDLDNTLLDSNREISQENLEAIRNFESKGNHFIICSGRVPFALKKYQDILNSKDVVTSNGALIISNNKIIKKQLLSYEIAKYVTQYAMDNMINVRYYLMDHMVLLNNDINNPQGFIYPGSIFVDKENVYKSIENKEIIKVAFFSNDKELLDKAEKEILKNIPNVEISFSSKEFMEINAINQNKGNGIIDYCKLNNIDLKDTIALGDNDNDIPMLKVAGYSACPSNSIKEVKDIVNYVCKNDNNNHAIKEILELL